MAIARVPLVTCEDVDSTFFATHVHSELNNISLKRNYLINGSNIGLPYGRYHNSQIRTTDGIMTVEWTEEQKQAHFAYLEEHHSLETRFGDQFSKNLIEATIDKGGWFMFTTFTLYPHILENYLREKLQLEQPYLDRIIIVSGFPVQMDNISQQPVTKHDGHPLVTADTSNKNLHICVGLKRCAQQFLQMEPETIQDVSQRIAKITIIDDSALHVRADTIEQLRGMLHAEDIAIEGVHVMMPGYDTDPVELNDKHRAAIIKAHQLSDSPKLREFMVMPRQPSPPHPHGLFTPQPAEARDSNAAPVSQHPSSPNTLPKRE